MPGRLRLSAAATLLPLLTAALPVALTAVPAAARAAAAPTVTKVEPPSWWTGSTVNPLRLLIYGTGLGGARVESAPGLTVSNVKVTGHGTYLFADVAIDPSAAPGPRALRVVTAAGVATARFDVTQPLTRAGRFQGFGPADVVYLIMPDRFADGDPAKDRRVAQGGVDGRGNPHLYHGGDFQGIIDHLPYLRDLGVTAVWINPVYQNKETVYPGDPPSADYHGYGTVDMYKVEDQFGDMSKLRELVDKAHALGIKIIQDQVANHVGQTNPWVADPPTPTWFNGTVADHDNNAYQIWTVMDPHAGGGERDPTLDGWFADILPDMDQGDPEVARYEIQNAIWWVGMAGFDGIRQDTMPYVPRAFWSRWNTAIDREFPHVNAVGEVFDGDAALVSYFQGGQTHAGIDTKMDSLFDYPLYFPLRRAFAQGDSFHDLADDLAHDWLFPEPGHLMTFLGNHDVQRFMNEQGATPQGLELADTFLLTTRGVPVIYYGDEIGMAGGNDPDNRRDFPGGFPGDAQNAFTAAGRTPPQQEIWRRVSRLAHLRASLPALSAGAQTNLYYSDHHWAYARVAPGAAGAPASVAIVALNNDSQPATITVPLASIAASMPGVTQMSDRLGTLTTPVPVQAGSVRLTLPPDSGVVLTP